MDGQDVSGPGSRLPSMAVLEAAAASLSHAEGGGESFGSTTNGGQPPDYASMLSRAGYYNSAYATDPSASTAASGSYYNQPYAGPSIASSSAAGAFARATESPQIDDEAASPSASTSTDQNGTGPRKNNKKRKSTSGEDGQDGSKKAAKNARACDQCRARKTRCIPILDTTPPTCNHCKSHNRECTWFLPISETRFRRAKTKEGDPPPMSAAAQSIASVGHRLPPSISSAASAANANIPVGPSPPFLNAINAPHLASSRVSDTSSPENNSSTHSNGHRREHRILGPTSISHLIHSTSTFPTDHLASFDTKYSQTLMVKNTGDGFLRIVPQGDFDPSDPNNATGPVAIQGIEREDAEKLLNYYFSTHAVHFPIVSKADLSAEPSPLLFNALCGVSALSHHVKPSILRTIKSTIKHTLRDDDVLDNASIENIQALLVYAFSLEFEKGAAGSKTWNLLGVAIRMAQDIGLHRRIGSEIKDPTEADHTELRRRVWGGCLIADRWIAAIYGSPMMIDLHDCDVMFPSVFDIRPGHQFDPEERPFLFNSALISLSIILGDILKQIYSPTGIMTLSAAGADKLIADLDSWLLDLPEELQFQGPIKSTTHQGFLHLLYIPISFLLTRPFMRISFQLPERFAHISVGIDQWTKMENNSREAIEWVDKNDSCLEGWFVGVYAFFISALCQYHSHVRRRDVRSLNTLRLARDVIKRLVTQDTECHVRAKISEILHLLYQTASSVSKWAPEAAAAQEPVNQHDPNHKGLTPLNPTAGVRQRVQDWHTVYKRDGKDSHFVTTRPLTSHDPSFVRSAASSPRANQANVPTSQNYSDCVRSTHDPSELEETAQTANGLSANDQQGRAVYDHQQPQAMAMSQAPSAMSALSMMNLPADTPLPEGFTFPDQINFNPMLNQAASQASTPFASGGFAGPSSLNLLDFGIGDPSQGSAALSNADPGNLLDWQSWNAFFSQVPGADQNNL